MFRKTIQNIETTRITGNQPQYPQSQLPNGYNTQRYDRYIPMPEEPKPSQRKNISSGQFSQLKKIQANKTSELVIRECDPTELNHYKKPAMRPMEENMYPYQAPPNSSNKKQRLAINPRQKPYDSNFKEPLEQIHFSDRDNKSERYSSGMDSFFDLQQQFQGLKQYLLQSQSQQSIEMKKLKTNINQIQVQCMGELQSVANQVSRELNKHQEDMFNINKRGIETQRQLRYFKETFNSFVKDNEEKMQSLVLEMNGGSTKKSKTNDQFGVDLKSSTHCITTGGVGTSMSVNFQNDNINLKLYNETSAQLQMLKNQLEQCKQKIELLEKDTKILQLQRKTSKEEVKETIKEKIDLKEVERMIIQKFSEERKKNSFTQKIQQLDLKTKDLYKVYQDMDSNIKGMNAEFGRVINGTVIKKEKMLEAKLIAVEEKIIEITQKISPLELLETMKPHLKSQLSSILEQKSSNIKVIKIREPNCQQKTKLDTAKNAEFTYLMDEQGHLLDPSGNYIVETLENGSKQRVKIDKSVIYLLESQGIEIKTT